MIYEDYCKLISWRDKQEPAYDPLRNALVTSLEQKRKDCIEEMKANGTYALTNPDYTARKWWETDVRMTMAIASKDSQLSQRLLKLKKSNCTYMNLESRSQYRSATCFQKLKICINIVPNYLKLVAYKLGKYVEIKVFQ